MASIQPSIMIHTVFLCLYFRHPETKNYIHCSNLF
uniref:Uncharacterized protein n=1 Tax=Rhizophora mucronata TaxID=61149 RepID=A0A2P2NKV1_RHIMU